MYQQLITIKQDGAKKCVFDRGESKDVEGQGIHIRSDLFSGAENVSMPSFDGTTSASDPTLKQKLSQSNPKLETFPSRSVLQKDDISCPNMNENSTEDNLQHATHPYFMDEGKLYQEATSNQMIEKKECFKFENSEYFETDAKDANVNTISKQDIKLFGQSSATLEAKIENREYFEFESKSLPPEIKAQSTLSSTAETSSTLQPNANESIRGKAEMSMISFISEALSKLEGINGSSNGKYFCSLCQMTFDKDNIESHSKGGKHVSKILKISESHAKSLVKEMKKEKLFDKIRVNMKLQKEKKFNIEMSRKHKAAFKRKGFDL